MLKDLLDGEGDWWPRLQRARPEKFAAPTVSGRRLSEDGLLGRVQRRARGVLELESYVATRARAATRRASGCATCPTPSRVQVLRDGAHARRLARRPRPSSIEIETTSASTATRSPPATAAEPADATVSRRRRAARLRRRGRCDRASARQRDRDRYRCQLDLRSLSVLRGELRERSSVRFRAPALQRQDLCVGCRLADGSTAKRDTSRPGT